MTCSGQVGGGVSLVGFHAVFRSFVTILMFSCKAAASNFAVTLHAIGGGGGFYLVELVSVLLGYTWKT
jgi:hypothetical protein